MQLKNLFLVLSLVLLIGLVSPQIYDDCDIYGNCLDIPQIKPEPTNWTNVTGNFLAINGSNANQDIDINGFNLEVGNLTGDFAQISYLTGVQEIGGFITDITSLFLGLSGTTVLGGDFLVVSERFLFGTSPQLGLQYNGTDLVLSNSIGSSNFYVETDFFAENICYTDGVNCTEDVGFTTDQNDELNTTGSPTFDTAVIGEINISDDFISASGNDIKLEANGQNIFRGLTGWTGTWSDSVDTTYFQVGKQDGNIAFSTKNGARMLRVLFPIHFNGGFQITNKNTGIIPPLHQFEILYNNVILFAVDGQNPIIRLNTSIIELGKFKDSYLGGSANLKVYDNGTLFANENLTGNGAGITGLSTEKAWTFTSPSGSSGTFYYGGFYNFNSGNNDFNPSVNVGDANSAHASHFLIVTAGGDGAGDTTINVSGVSIQDNGTRIVNDWQVLTITQSEAVGSYHETSKKWIGQVTVVKLTGNDVQMNYGFTKYWDNNNNNFTITGVEATWLGGANDAGADIILRHHKTTGWTYNAGSTPSPPPAVASMVTDYVTENDVVNNENGAYKRSNLNTFVEGDNGEGTIIEIVTTSNKAFELGNFLMRIKNEE